MPQIEQFVSIGSTWHSILDGSVINPGGSSQRFPGDPGVGFVMSGANYSTDSQGIIGINWFDTNTSPDVNHAVARMYQVSEVGGGTTYNWAGIDNAISLGRMPLATTKFTQFTASQISSGAADAQLLTEVNRCKARAPRTIWLGWFHEPEDDFNSPTTAAQYRAAARYIVLYFRAQGVTNVAWEFSSFQTDWTYMAGGITSHGGEGYLWDPDWKGTLSGAGGTEPSAIDWYTGAGSSASVVDMFSFDQYSPLIGSTNYRTYVAQFTTMKNKLDLWQRPTKPFIVPEVGTSDEGGSTLSQWQNHWADLTNSAVANNVIAFCYFNFDNSPVGNAVSLATEDPTGFRFSAYQSHFLADARVLSREEIATLV
jgi:hypothetical protein